MSGHVVDRLADFEFEALEPSEHAAVDAHLRECPSCARERAALRETLSKVTLDLSPSLPSRSLRDVIVGAVGPKPSYEGFVRRVVRLFDISEDRARAILGELHDRAAWEPYIPGVTLFHFHAGPRTNGADAGLVWFAAGLDYPRHTHVGDEYMLILSGCLRDDEGRWAYAGDTLHMAPGTSHSFVIGPNEPCIAAVLLEGGLPILDPSAPQPVRK